MELTETLNKRISLTLTLRFHDPMAFIYQERVFKRTHTPTLPNATSAHDRIIVKNAIK